MKPDSRKTREEVSKNSRPKSALRMLTEESAIHQQNTNSSVANCNDSYAKLLNATKLSQEQAVALCESQAISAKMAQPIPEDEGHTSTMQQDTQS